MPEHHDNRLPSSHVCTGPGCPGCYAVYNAPRREDRRDPEYDEYLRREQHRWERA